MNYKRFMNNVIELKDFNDILENDPTKNKVTHKVYTVKIPTKKILKYIKKEL